MQPMPQHEIHRRFFMMCFLAAFFLTFGAPSGAEAGVPRILVVGDSWAQGIFEFGAFDKVFAAHEMADRAPTNGRGTITARQTASASWIPSNRPSNRSRPLTSSISASAATIFFAQPWRKASSR